MFKTRLNYDGIIACYKTRLVAQGYQQKEGIDYFEIVSPISKLTIVCIFLAIVTYYGWKIKRFDVSNVFIHGQLSENIYMHHPPGFEDSNFSSYVCKLNKVIYSLKQSPHLWFPPFPLIYNLSFHKAKQIQPYMCTEEV